MNDRAGVLFDVDGTLVDTTYLHAVSWWEALRQYEHDVPMAVIHRAIGMGGDKLLDHLLGPGRDLGDDDALAAAHTAIYATHWERLRPLPGAVELLRTCADRGLAVVLASSASPRELGVLRRTLGVDDVLAAATSIADADEGKPAPDILEAAMESAGVTRAVYVGDAVWDARAATRLGLPCIGLTCGGTGEAELREAGAGTVWPDPAALLKDIDSSPIGALLA
jgi:HAD superfamily hydrolase (TIGR01549 family)